MSVLKNSRTLDLVLKKGSGIDLFPGESSGYSSSSSVAEEAVNQSSSKSKRLSIVAEEGDDRSQRKACQCKSFRKNNLKSSGSIDSIFDNISNEGSSYREKSKSIEILTDTNDKKTVTFQNRDHVSKTFLNYNKPVPKPSTFCHGAANQTVIKIESKDTVKANRIFSAPAADTPLGNGVIAVEVHKSNEECENEKISIEESPSLSSFSSACSLSSAISKEIQKRNEVRIRHFVFDDVTDNKTDGESV